MKFPASLASALVIFATCISTAHAQLYWDINGDLSGATDGNGLADGTWDAVTSNWNLDSDGIGTGTQAWIPDSAAVFSAGLDASGAVAVTIDGTVSTSGVTFEDGFVTLAGGQLDLTGAATLNVPSISGEATINSVIGGAVGLNATGTGVLRLRGANTYTGPTTIGTATEGIIVRLLAADVIPDTSVLTLVRGSLNTVFELNGFNETVRSIAASALAADGDAPTIAIGANELTIEDQAGDLFTYGGLYTSSAGGKIIKNGDGTLILNNFPGGFSGGEFVINNGVVGINQNNVFGTNANGSKLTLNGGTIRKGSGNAGSNVGVLNVDITNSFTVEFTAANDLQFVGGTGATAGNTITTLKADNPTITVIGGSGTLIFSGKITEDGTLRGFTKAGAGTMILGSPNNDYTGETTIQEGFLRLRKQTQAMSNGAARIGDGNAAVNLSGGTLEYNGSLLTAGDPRSFTVTNPINVTANSGIRYFSTTGDTGMAGNLGIDFIFEHDSITGTGGTLTFSHQGTANNNPFRPTFSGSGFDFSQPVVIENHATNTTNQTILHSANTAGAQTWSGDISGTGSIKRVGADGTTILSGANTYAGGTTVESGTLTVSGSSATLGTGNVTVTGGTLDISTGVANAIADTAMLSISGTGLAALGAGINELLAGLVLDGIAQGDGTYGSSDSSAIFQFDQWFSGDGILTVAAIPTGLPGDYNEDNVVDAADYVLWRKMYGSETALPNDDTAGVGDDDYDRWTANFGATQGGGGGIANASGAVPEPGTWVLAMLTLLVAGTCRRRPV